MLSKFPQRLTGILGDDAKLAFRTQSGGIRRLAENRSISRSDAYWEQYVTLFDSTSDVFTLISSNDIRRALVDAPENVATLTSFLCSRLFDMLSDPSFPSPPENKATTFATTFIKTAKTTAGMVHSTQRDHTKEVLNSIRVLQRILPVVFEPEFDTFEKDLFWSREAVQEQDVAANESQPQFVIDDEDEDEEQVTPGPPLSPNTRSKSSDSNTSPQKMGPTLAERLISCVIDLLFYCGFTLPSKIQVEDYKINYVIWEKGIGSTIDPGPNQAHDQNKVEVLRLLLVLLSKQIYISPSSLLAKASPYSTCLAQQTPRRHVLTLLCSLLNTVMNSSNGSVTLGNVASALPYNHLVFKGEDMRITLVGESLQVLCAVLDFQSSSCRDVFSIPSDPFSAAPTTKTNAFRYFLAKLHRLSDFKYIAEGIIGILAQYMAAINNLLPGSKRPIPYLLETIVFFWKMVELNKKFRTYILESDKAIELMTYLLCYFMESKDKPESHGLCRAISYIIQTLSAEEGFNTKLASPMRMQLPAKWACQGTAGDFMINSIYNVVATTSGQLNSLYPALVVALSNSAPYFRHISVTSASRLLSLFNAFTNPSFLLSDEGHPRLLFFLLEVFNGVILNNLNQNPNLVYAILRSHKSFEDLGTFTLARGLREIRRVQLAKEEQAKHQAGKTKGKARVVSHEEAPEQEKARLLSGTNRDALGLTRDGDLEAGIAAEQVTSPQSESFAEADGEILPSPNEERIEPSEKAKGKMRARSRSASLEMSSSLERIAAAGVGRNGFVPTQDWVTSWQQGLPLDTVQLTISELLPKVQSMQSSMNSANTTSAIIDFLRSASIKEALPEIPSPPCRKFMWSDSSIIWLTSLIWGEIYVRGMSPLGIWNATNVRLFHVKHTQSQTLQISDAVSSVVGGIGGFLSRSGSTDSLPTRNRIQRG